MIARHAVSRRSFLKTASGVVASGAGLAALASCAPATPTPAASQPTQASQPAGAAPPTTAPTTVATSTTTTPVASKPSSRPAELLWLWSGNTAEEQKFWESQAEGFKKKYPDVTVKPEFVGGGGIYDKTQTMAAGGAIPDIIFWNGARVQAWGARKMALSMKPLIERDKFDIEDFDPEITKMLSFKGEVFGLAYDYGAALVLYNVDMFDAKGVKYPTQDWTWQDLLDTAHKLTDEKNGQWGFVHHTDFFRMMPQFIWANGGDYVDDAITKFTFDMPETIEAIQWVADLRVKEKVAPAPEAGATFGADSFYTGKIGMYMDGPWTALNMRAKFKGKWDFALAPTGKAGRMSWIAGTGYAIGRTTKFPEEAWNFCKELTSKETLTLLAKAGRGFPGRKSAQQAYLEVKPPDHPEMAVEGAKQARYLKTTAAWQELNNILNSQIGKVYLGQATAAQVVESLKPQFDDLMKKHQQALNAS